MVKKSRSASKGLRKRAESVVARLPTPTRTRRHADQRESFDPNEDAVIQSRSFLSTLDLDDEAFDFDDSVFEIGSDDEEEQAFLQMAGPTEEGKTSTGHLNEALSTWGKPGECSPGEKRGQGECFPGECISSRSTDQEKGDKLGALGNLSLGKVHALSLGSLSSEGGAPTAFYMGTPRDCM